MILKFSESEIEIITNRYKYVRKENELIELKDEIKSNGYLKKKQLQLVANWKSPRSAGYVNKNTDEYVKEITSLAFSVKDERARIEILTILDGVSWPTASVLLHFFHKEKYPIIDFRSLWSLSLEVPKQYKYSFWEQYVNFCRDIAKRNKVSMRILDCALWQYSKENQKI